MAILYPFLPKSNHSLQPGQYWAIPLASGAYACGRVLDVPPPNAQDRMGFYAGLMQWTDAVPPTDESLAGAPLLEQGRVSLRTLTMPGYPILGHRPLALDGLVLPITVEQACWQPAAVLLQGYTIVGASQRHDHPLHIRPLPEQSGYEYEDNPTALPLQATWGYQMLRLLAEKHFG